MFLYARPGITWRVSSFSHQATTFRTASVYGHGVNLRKHTDVLGDAGDVRASKPRGSIQARSLTNKFASGRWSSVSAFLRLHSLKLMMPCPCRQTSPSTAPPAARSADRQKSAARCSRSSGERAYNRVNALRKPISGSVALPLAGGDVGVKLMAKTSFEELVVKRLEICPTLPALAACARVSADAAACAWLSEWARLHARR